MPKEDRKSRRRSLVANRHLLIRALNYAWPFRQGLMWAMVFAFAGSMLGAFSLLPMIPVIKMVIDPTAVEEKADRYERDLARKQAELELASGDVLDLDTGSALGGLIIRTPSFEAVSLWVTTKKNEVYGAVYNFLLDHRGSAIYYIVAFLFIMQVVKSILIYFARYQMARAIFSSLQNMKVDLYKGCLDLDMVAFQTQTSGNLISRLSTDAVKIRSVFESMLSQSVLVPFEVMALLAVLFVISPEITLITLVALPIMVFPIIVLGRRLRSLSRRDAEEDAYLVDVMQETLQGMVIVKAYGSEAHESKRFRKVAKEQLRRQIRRSRLALAAPVIMDVLTMASMGAVIIVGAWLVVDLQRIDAASLIVYLFLLLRLYKPLKGISGGVVKVQRGLASCERIFEVIDAVPTVKQAENAADLPPFERDIIFANVNFRYAEEGENVLSSLNLKIQKGETVALVGASGSGKTTIARLIPRFFDPQEGSILVDGRDIRKLTFQSLRSQIAIVTQETILFDSTIRYNIAYGRLDATGEEIEAAARAANAHDFIMSLPDGYETRVGERGGQLSGGQRQRLAIARAILRNAPLLILDEATSALDNESEKLVQEALDHLMENRTSIVIAHRLSTIRNADRIVVLQDGRIVEEGTHAELLASSGRYLELIRAEEERGTRRPKTPPKSQPDDLEDEERGRGDDVSDNEGFIFGTT